MKTDHELLIMFETGLDPANVEGSTVPARLLGYGEISAIFQIESNETVAYKRMPLFRDRSGAERYADQYHEYCGLLSAAGLRIPESVTHIVEVPGRPVVLYIAQQRFPADRIGHRLVHALDREGICHLLERIVLETNKVWAFNASQGPSLELAIDAQISNWAFPGDREDELPYYLDTSTPLYRKTGVEQLDPRLLLQAAPSYLRWLLERLFLDDVMNRYYDPRKVYTDLAANLYKEQRPDLIPETLGVINSLVKNMHAPLTEREVSRYYRGDRVIWSLFLNLRKLDRWISTRLLRRRYEFMLPGRIKR